MNIKKIILIILAVLFLPTAVFAYSGACSSYGGVNCAVIFNGGGQLVCSYGQTVMPVSYADITDCFAGLGCSASQLDTLMQQYNVPSFYQGVVSAAQDVVNKQNEAKQWEDKALSGDPLAMGQQGVQNSYNTTMWGNAEDAVKYALQVVPLDIQQLETQTRQVATACKNLGYQNSQNVQQQQQQQYQQPQQQQQPTCPTNSYYAGGLCYCNSGYQWNSQQTACVKIPPSNNISAAPQEANTASTQDTVKQEKQSQTNSIQNNSENKNVEQGSTNQGEGFFSKMFHSIKNFLSNLFK